MRLCYLGMFPKKATDLTGLWRHVLNVALTLRERHTAERCDEEVEAEWCDEEKYFEARFDGMEVTVQHLQCANWDRSI